MPAAAPGGKTTRRRDIDWCGWKWKFCHELSEGPIRLGSHGGEVSFVVFVDRLWVDDDRIDEFVMIDFNMHSCPFSLS